MIKYCLACYILVKEGMDVYNGKRIPCCKKCFTIAVGTEVCDLMFARGEQKNE